MGVSYEVNWYLVIASEEKIKKLDNCTYITVKSDKRIYPISSQIPLIIKDKGCLGIVSVISFKVEENQTEIEFEYKEKYDAKNIIGKHYYEMYLKMKSR